MLVVLPIQVLILLFWAYLQGYVLYYGQSAFQRGGWQGITWIVAGSFLGASYAMITDAAGGHDGDLPTVHCVMVFIMAGQSAIAIFGMLVLAWIDDRRQDKTSSN